MSLIGTALNVSLIAGQLLQTILATSEHVVIQELQDGTTVHLLKKYVINHSNAAKVGTLVDPQNFQDDPELSIVLAQEPTTGAYKTYLVNTYPNIDFNASFTQTTPNADVSVTSYTAPRRNPVEPNAVDVTQDVINNADGNLTSAPIQLEAIQPHVAMKPLPGRRAEVLLNNFQVPNITTSGTFSLFVDTSYEDYPRDVVLNWVTSGVPDDDDPTGAFSGFQVNSALTYDVNVTVNLGSENPAFSFTAPKTLVPAGGFVETDFAQSDKPFTFANVSVVRQTTDEEERRKWIQAKVKYQEEEGKMIYFKGNGSLALAKKKEKTK